MPPTPFYFDWTFWAFVTSLFALTLSQFPPLRDYLRTGKLMVEVGSVIVLNHVVGYSNAGVVLSVRNIGSAAVRVKKIEFRFFRDGKEFLVLPVLDYFPEMDGSSSISIFPFTVLPGQEWLHPVNAYVMLSRVKDKELREFNSAVRRDINQKLEARKSEAEVDKSVLETPVVVDEELLKKGLAWLHSNFEWTAGDYQFEFKITTENDDQAMVHRYAFTLFESDSAELQELSEGYKYGFGIGLPHERHKKGVVIPIRAA